MLITKFAIKSIGLVVSSLKFENVGLVVINNINHKIL